MATTHALSYTKEYKYLGFWFNEHLDANMSISRVSVAAKKALGVLIARSRNSGGFMFDVYTRLFNTVVMPIITYSAAVWGFNCYPSLQQIQNWAMRSFMGLGKVTPIAALQGDMGWTPVETNLKTEVLKCWHKLCNMDKVRLPKQIFRWMGTLADKGNVNWVSHTRKLIQNINLPLEGVTLDNRKCFSDLAWDTLAEVAMTSWHQSIWDPKACSSESGGRLALYSPFQVPRSTQS